MSEDAPKRNTRSTISPGRKFFLRDAPSGILLEDEDGRTGAGPNVASALIDWANKLGKRVEISGEVAIRIPASIKIIELNAPAASAASPRRKSTRSK